MQDTGNDVREVGDALLVEGDHLAIQDEVAGQLGQLGQPVAHLPTAP
jgi:hypothetical protein